MEIPFVDLKSQYRAIQSEIDEAICAVLESGQFIGGAIVRDFESLFASLLSVKHCIGVGNGTDALFIALKALGVSSGDEVITPSFGWISSAETITLAGGKPVFADVLPDTMTIDPDAVQRQINSHTKGIILIHLYGQAAQAHQLRELANRHDLFLLEDCAQAHLTSEEGIMAGKIGHAGAFSFYPTKNLGAYGDAGCIVTDDSNLEGTARLYANHGGLGKHLMEGINSRLDPMQAAILSVKCRHLETWTNSRTKNAELYLDHLNDIPEIALPCIRANVRHTFHQFVIRAKTRTELLNSLLTHGVQTMIHYPTALPNLPAFRHLGHSKSDFPVASRLQEEVLSLPVHPGLSKDQIMFVCEKIREFYKPKRI